MRNRSFIFFAMCAFAALALVALSCSELDPITQPPVNTGSLDFSNYIAIGSSLTAGFLSGGLVEGNQAHSFPAMIADAVGGVKHAFPNVSEPGAPPLLYVSDFSGPVIEPKSLTPGVPTNTTYPGIYNNMGIPGARLNDLLTVRPDPADGSKAAFNLVLRDSMVFGPTLLAQVTVATKPTVATVWIGSNDVLGSALAGTDAAMTPAASFEADYGTLMDALLATGTDIVAANLVNIPTIPFFTTIPPVVVDPSTRQPVIIGGMPVPLLGTGGPLPLDALVLLTAAPLLAQGIGIPAVVGGTDNPLPDNVVLMPSETVNIATRITSLNLVIRNVCSSRGIPVVDMNAFYNSVLATPVTIRGEEYDTSFLTGGLFSVDGVHPSVLGYWLVAREFIRVMNEHFGAAIPDPPLPLTAIRNPLPEVSASPGEKSQLLATLDPEDFAGVFFGVGAPGYRVGEYAK